MHADMPLLKAPEKEQAQSQKGYATVEFMLLLHLFLHILLGIFFYSIALLDKIVLTNASREGARAGAISSSTISAQTAAASGCDCKLISMYGTLSATITPTVDSSTNMCTVETRCYYPPVYIFPGIDLSATTSMRLESP